MKYRLAEKIGSGGMAEVFRAIGEGPEGFERAFVIKRIHPRLSDAPEFVRMFVDEAKISARLIHPNILQVFEFAYQDGSYYIVMEPVEGVDMGLLLRGLERRHEVPSPVFVAEVGRQACRGLDFAHNLTGTDGKPLLIVHRDVTPPNIMVAWNGTVKIVDFGIARAVQELRTNMTDAGMVKGKMSYVAPELLEGHPADARSDLFSLGVVLHELLSGRRLFVGGNDLETLKLVKEMPIPPPSARNPGVKPALDRIVMRALARDPNKRYQGAREMGDELEAVTVRDRYSTRAFAKKARELVPASEERAERPPDAPLPEGHRPAPQSLGEKHAEIVADAADAGPARRPAPVPPPPPRAARAAHAPSLPMRWLWVATGVPTAMVVLLFAVVAFRRPAPPPAPPPPRIDPRPTTVQVALDSTPQGATVTVAVTPGGEPRQLGETPLLLDLPRARSTVEVVLSKPGFAPLTVAVIPNRDKDLLVPLERAAPATPVGVVIPALPTKRALSRRAVPGTAALRR